MSRVLCTVQAVELCQLPKLVQPTASVLARLYVSSELIIVCEVFFVGMFCLTNYI